MNLYLQNVDVALDGWRWAISPMCSWYGHSYLVLSLTQGKSLWEFHLSSSYFMNPWFRHNYQ